MTLHDTAEISKKVGIGLSIALGVLIFITISVKVAAFIHSIFFPPKIAPPNEAYSKLQPIAFPPSTVKGKFTYTINTNNGSLPQDFPDRILVYPMVVPQPNLLNLDQTRNKVQNLGFVDQKQNVLPEIPRGGPNYEWDESNGFQRRIVYNIVTNGFTMTSNYVTSLTVLNAQNLGDQSTAVSTVQDFLNSINSFTSDIDLNLTQNPSPDISYTTTPQLYSISNGQITPTTSLSNAQVIRVDLYQKEIDYSLTAGMDQDLSHFQNFAMKMPVMYPHPPYSTMNFLVASGDNSTVVVSALYNHQTVNLQPDTQATYPIKSADQAFDDLKKGKGYIASYSGTDSQILINNVFLAYYIGQVQQDYLQPVVVFQGQNGFFAYVPALADEALQ